MKAICTTGMTWACCLPRTGGIDLALTLAVGNITMTQPRKGAHVTNDTVPRISDEIFRHLVDLAQLELDDKAAEYLKAQLNAQLDVIRQLDAMEVDESVPISSHGVPYAPDDRGPLRADETRASGLSDEILANAPEREGRYIVVPDIPHEELE